MFLPVMVQAQKEYPIEQVSAINVGDGRILFRDLKTEKPLNVLGAIILANNLLIL
jgi:hypothetical protein